MVQVAVNPFAGDSPRALIVWQKQRIAELEAALERALPLLLGVRVGLVDAWTDVNMPTEARRLDEAISIVTAAVADGGVDA